MSKIQPTQPSTFAIRTSHYVTKKLQKSLSVYRRFFADPKNLFFSETAVLRLGGLWIVTD